MNQIQLKRVSILPAPKMPLASQRTLANHLPPNISKSVLLSQFLESPSFLQLIEDESQFKNSLSLRSFLEHYFVGISSDSIHYCIQENLPSDAVLLPHSSNTGLTVNQVLERIRKSRKVRAEDWTYTSLPSCQFDISVSSTYVCEFISTDKGN